MDAMAYQAMLKARQHAFLTADFKAYGIDPEAFGFYNQPAFRARESLNPAYVSNYAEWVMTRPMSPDYEAHVRATVPKLAHLLATAFADHGALGRCVPASSMMTRMLERLHVWSFCVFGSVMLEAPDLGLRDAFQTIGFKCDPRNIIGHSWVCAPPYFIVDTTLALQHWNAPISPLIPSVVLADAQAPIIHAQAVDCVNESVRAFFAQAEGWHDPYLHHRLDPRLAGFLRLFPARGVTTQDLRMRFVPVVIRQPAETLAQMELDHAGATGRFLWNKVVAPAFHMPPLSEDSQDCDARVIGLMA